MIGFVKYADYASRGVLPSAGGLLDQPNWFVEAASFMEAETQRVKNEQFKG